ncbi:N-acetyltransferase family protein [Sinomicrobium sp. M5D2P17]
MIQYGLAKSEADLEGILELQKKNFIEALSPEEASNQGFVTVRHDRNLLERMNAEAPSIIARDEDKIIGYCLAMTKKFKEDIPVLIPMFNAIDRLSYNKEYLKDIDYIVSGQVCVDKAYRGQGIFDNLYRQYRDVYKDAFPYILTEILTVNQRSIKAHQRIGFHSLHSYSTPDNTVWDIVIWDWTATK